MSVFVFTDKNTEKNKMFNIDTRGVKGGFGGSGLYSTPSGGKSKSGSGFFDDIASQFKEAINSVGTNVPNKTNKGNLNDTGFVLGDGSGSGSATSAADLAYLTDQEARLRGQLGRTSTIRDQGLQQLLDNYNKNVSQANTQRSQAIEDFNTQREDTTRDKLSAVGQVDTNARTLNDSIRRILGLASGSSSSAYQIAAPNAVARDASMKRAGVNDAFGANFRDIDTAETRAKSAFEALLEDLADQRDQSEREFRTGIGEQRNSIEEQLANIARERAVLQGGDYNAARAASQQYESSINDRNARLDSLFEKFRNPYKVTPVKVDTPELRDYTVDRTMINPATGQVDPGAPYRQFLPGGRREDEERYI